jgi:hypothetical protein
MPSLRSKIDYLLNSNWNEVLEQDVDGPKSIARNIDINSGNTNEAAERLARTIFWTSLILGNQTARTNRGIEPSELLFSCIQPGDSIRQFIDALESLKTRARYIHLNPQDSERTGRLWFDIFPPSTAQQQCDYEI